MGYSIEGIRELLALDRRRRARPRPARRGRVGEARHRRLRLRPRAAPTAATSCTVGAIPITLMHTPGHTPGSQCFLVDGRLVAGDTLFLEGCGRTDLPGGDPDAMYESLTQRLAKVPDDTVLFPGHLYSPEPSATMGETRATQLRVPRPQPRPVAHVHGRLTYELTTRAGSRAVPATCARAAGAVTAAPVDRCRAPGSPPEHRPRPSSRTSLLLKSSCRSGARYGTPVAVSSTASDHARRSPPVHGWRWPPAATRRSHATSSRRSAPTSRRTMPTSVSSWSRQVRPRCNSSACPPLSHQRNGAAAKMSTVAATLSGSQSPSPGSATSHTLRSRGTPSGAMEADSSISSDDRDRGAWRRPAREVRLETDRIDSEVGRALVVALLQDLREPVRRRGSRRAGAHGLGAARRRVPRRVGGRRAGRLRRHPRP